MTHDVVRLAEKFLFGEAGHGDKLIVDEGDAAIRVRLRHDHGVVVKLVFDVGDGQVLLHDSNTVGNREYVERNDRPVAVVVGMELAQLGARTLHHASLMRESVARTRA